MKNSSDLSPSLIGTCVKARRREPMMRKKCKKIILAAVTASLAVLTGSAAFFFGYSSLRFPEKRRGKKKNYGKYAGMVKEGVDWFLDRNPERIILTSEDGLKLSARFLPAEGESRKVLILMHGYRAEPLVDFAGLYRFYHEQGYHLLVPSQRSHGDSEGKYICFGIKERFDCKMWVEYIRSRLGKDCCIYLSGISMGCATVLMAAGTGLPENVRGIIADCGFTSPYDIFKHVLRKNFGLPAFPLIGMTQALAKLRAGFTYREASTVDVLKKCRIPVLFIHGGADTFVPLRMTLDNYLACAAPKELLVIEGAGHAVSNMEDPVRYREAALRFMKKFEK